MRCYACCAPVGFAERVGKKDGFVDVRAWFGFGEVVDERRCDKCTEKPGKLVCGRCKGKKKLLFRSAAWR